MSLSDRSYDLLIVGGGIAGSALGRVMALAGARVLIIEKETAFRDRIRGEVLLPWGSVEAKELGIYDLLLATCGREAGQEILFVNGEAQPPRDYLTSTPKQTCTLSFFHPEMQETLLGEAAKAGAEVWRGALLRALHPAHRPRAEIAFADEVRHVSARLVIGADGRESQVATLLGFERLRDPPELFTAGLQLEGDLPTKPALYFLLHGISGRGSILVQTRPGNYRAYLFHHKDALPRRLSGARDYAAVMGHFREVGIPADWLDVATPHGVFATFDGAHRWVAEPVRHGCALIGDAAGAGDPVWGNGLSRTLRDVRLLRDRLLGDADWSAAAGAYLNDHNAFFHRLRRIERFQNALYFSMGDAGEARRRRASALMEKHPELSPDMTGLGPEACYSEETAKLLLEDTAPA